MMGYDDQISTNDDWERRATRSRCSGVVATSPTRSMVKDRVVDSGGVLKIGRLTLATEACIVVKCSFCDAKCPVANKLI
ncbi:hypothetical protein U1Q18_016947 [Sarracenia purpurea var. burkii]